jgi:hypothetical protein
MRAIAAILVFGVLGVSPFFWGGKAEAQVRPPQKLSPCAELRLEIEQTGPVDTTAWPQERVLLGLFCAHQGDPGHQPPTVGVAVAEQLDIPPVDMCEQRPAFG